MAQAVTRAMGNGAQWGTERCLLAHGAPSVQPGFRQSADQWGWGPLLSISGSLVSCAVSGVCCHPSTCLLPGSGAGWGLGGLLTPEKVSMQPVNQKSLSCQAKSFLETLGGRTSSPLNQAWFGLYTSWLTWEFGSISFLVAQKIKNPPAMWEAWVRSLGWEDPLEKGKAPGLSILAWTIPWTEEPGGLQPMGSQSQTWQSD